MGAMIWQENIEIYLFIFIVYFINQLGWSMVYDLMVNTVKYCFFGK